jgi:DnaD/phage-associated family protein
MDSVIQFEGTVYEDGYGLIAQKVMRDRSLKGPSKLIYAYMCSFASVGKNGERIAFPSISLQCAELSMTEDTYYKWRKPLIDKGYIKITKQRKEGAKFDNNIYSILAIPVPAETKKVVELKDKKPHPKNTGMENEPYPKIPCTEKSSTENQGTNSISSIIISFKKEEEEEATQLEELISLFSNSIRDANKTIKKEIAKWLKVLPFEVIQAEIELAALNNARTWNYVETILIEDDKNNIRSAADVAKRVNEYKQSKKKKKSSNRKPTRTEMIPEWLDENNDNDVPPVEETEELAAKKKRIEEKLKLLNSK